MSQSNWPVAGFADILERVDRKITVDDTQTYECVGVRWPGLGTFIRESRLGADIRRKQQWIIREGDVVYNKLFAWKGAFAVAGADVDGCIVSDKFPTYRVHEGRVDPEYLRHYFRIEAIAQQAQVLSKGAAAISKLTLNPPDFWKLHVPLPALDEQRRIVARIDELAALIEEAQQLRAKARKEAERIMHAAIARVFARPGKEGWVTETLDQVADTATGGTPSRSSDEYFGGNIPWVKSAELKDTFIQSAEERLTDAGLRNSSAKIFPSGTVLVAMYGANVGKTGILGLAAATNQAVCAVFPHEEHLDKRFLYYFFRWKRPELLASSFGGAQPNISQKLIKALEIPFPCLVEEQRRGVAYLDGLQAQVDELTALHDATQAELDALLPSVLDRAFRGEL